MIFGVGGIFQVFFGFEVRVVKKTAMINVPQTSHFALVDLASQHRVRRQEIEKARKLLSAEKILVDVCKALNAEPEDVIGGTRKHHLVICRQIYCYVMKRQTTYTLVRIGELLMVKHDAVIRNIHIVKDYLEIKDAGFLHDWNQYLSNSKLFTKADFQ